MGCWHAYAKLRLHTEETLASFEQVTADLGALLHKFAIATCCELQTIELPRERAAQIRGAAKAGGAGPSAGTTKAKEFSLSTYKLHALGDYPLTIRERGTTDNYTTQWVRAATHDVSLMEPLLNQSHTHRLKPLIEQPRDSIQRPTSATPNGTLAN